MPTSVDLRQQRARVVESMRTITEAAEAENRNLDATEREAYDRHEADFTSLTERIGRAEALEQREADQAEPISSDSALPGGGTDEQRSQQRRSAFFEFVRRGTGRMAPEARALVENADGEVLVPEDLEAEIYRALPGLTIMRSLATVRPTQSNRVRRRSLDEVAVGWGKLETGTALTDSMSSEPDEEWTYVEDLYGLAKIGEDELDDTDANLEAIVSDSFARAVAEKEDTGFAVGRGHTTYEEPVGFMTAAGGVAVVAGQSEDYASTEQILLIDDLKRLIYGVPKQYRRNGTLVMSSAAELVVSTTKDADGQYLWQPSVQAGRPNTFLGYALENQEDVASIAPGARFAAFGDYQAAYRILTRSGLTIKRLEELYAEDGMIGFKARFRVGGDVVRPDALRILAAAAGS